MQPLVLLSFVESFLRSLGDCDKSVIEPISGAAAENLGIACCAGPAWTWVYIAKIFSDTCRIQLRTVALGMFAANAFEMKLRRNVCSFPAVGNPIRLRSRFKERGNHGKAKFAPPPELM